MTRLLLIGRRERRGVANFLSCKKEDRSRATQKVAVFSKITETYADSL